MEVAPLSKATMPALSICIRRAWWHIKTATQPKRICFGNKPSISTRAIWRSGWHYQVVKSDADRIICLENALRLGAKNPRIPQRLQDLRRRQRIMAGIPAEPIPARNHRLKWGLMMIVVIVLVMIALWVVGGSALGSL